MASQLARAASPFHLQPRFKRNSHTTVHRQTCAAQIRPQLAWMSGGGNVNGGGPLAAALLSVLTALQLVLMPLPSAADGGDFTLRSQPSAEDANEDYFETVPQGLASADSSTAPRLGALLEGPKGKQITQCVRKCVPTCLRGGQGSPGLGPMTMR